MRKAAGLLRGEAETAVIGRVADEDDRAMAAAAGCGKRVTHSAAPMPRLRQSGATATGPSSSAD